MSAHPSSLLPGRSALLACLLAAAASAGAVELPMDLGTLTTKDHKVYENAKIVGRDAVGVKITHDAGTARIPFARLPRELADQFQVKPGAAAEQLKKEAEEASAHDRAVTKGLAEAAGREMDENDRKILANEKPLSDAEVDALLPAEMRNTTFEAMLAPRDAQAGERIQYLEAFIERTFRLIDAANKEIHNKAQLATAAFEQGKIEEQNDVKSRARSNTRPSRDYPSLRRGDRINQWITNEKEKIAKAQKDIDEAAAEIRSLRKNFKPD